MSSGGFAGLGKETWTTGWYLLDFELSRGDSGHRRNGMYYGTPFYGGYGYTSPVPHPNVYAAAYGAYPFYGNQQLVS